MSRERRHRDGVHDEPDNEVCERMEGEMSRDATSLYTYSQVPVPDRQQYCLRSSSSIMLRGCIATFPQVHRRQNNRVACVDAWNTSSKKLLVQGQPCMIVPIQKDVSNDTTYRILPSRRLTPSSRCFFDTELPVPVRANEHEGYATCRERKKRTSYA